MLDKKMNDEKAERKITDERKINDERKITDERKLKKENMVSKNKGEKNYDPNYIRPRDIENKNSRNFNIKNKRNKIFNKFSESKKQGFF